MTMIIDRIVSSPIVFPKITPNDWDRWWKVWNSEATIATKAIKNHNDTYAPWRALNVYVKPGVDNVALTCYNIKTVLCPELFPSLFDNLDTFPMDIDIVQIVSSRSAVMPHTDHNKPIISIRSMLYDNNFTPTFYYSINGDKKYQTLPDDTNTWIYHDNKHKHGSDYYYGHSKHLIIYHGKIKQDLLKENLQLSTNQYSTHVIKDIDAVS